MYDLCHVRLNIRKNIFFYLLLLFELILSFTMILIGLDEKKTYSDRVVIYTQEADKQLLSLSNEQGLLTPDNFKIDDEHLLKHDLIFGKIHYVDYLSASGAVNSIQFIETTPHFFETYFQFSPNPQIYYASEQVIEQLRHVSYFLTENLSMSEGILSINDKVYPIEPFKMTPKQNIPTTIAESGDIMVNRAVFYINPQPKIGQPASLFLKMKQTQQWETIASHVNKHLKKTLYPISLLANFQYGSHQLAAFVRLFGWVSLIALIIIVLGTSAMLMLFIARRQQNMCIQHFFGASIFRLRCQIFAELFSVMIVAFSLSLFISIWIEPKVSSVYYTITPHIESSAMLLSTIVILALFITGLTSYKTKWTAIKER